MENIHSKCACSGDSLMNGVRQPILFGFEVIYLEKKAFCEPETILYKNTKKLF